MPWMPMRVSASRTSSSLNGLMTAMTSFMVSLVSFRNGPRRNKRTPGQLVPYRARLAKLAPVGSKIKRLYWRAHRQRPINAGILGNIGQERCRSPRAALFLAPQPDQAFLRHRGDQGAVLGKDPSTAEAASALPV